MTFVPRKRGVTEVLQFGKHKGRTLGDAIEEDAGWVRWALETLEDFDLDDEAERLFKACERD